jgi:hypothetical protein
MAVNVAEERGVLRLAEWLTAAAAAVLVIGVTGLFRHETTHAASAPDVWEQAAIAYPADHDPTVQSDVLQLTEWMRTDLSPRRERRMTKTRIIVIVGFLIAFGAGAVVGFSFITRGAGGCSKKARGAFVASHGAGI